MRVFFTNLGCKLNQAELESMARRFVAAGHEIATSLANADVHVVNTCTVTHVAARSSRKIARRGSRANPRLRTVLTGCYVSADDDEASRLAGVDLVVPNHEKERLLELVETAFEWTPRAPRTSQVWGRLGFGNSRALVKAQDGCNMRCAFCIIPATRGREQSRPLPTVVDEVERLVTAGFQEVVLTGVQISSYRWQGRGLADLVDAILQSTDLPRLRLSSIAPWRFDRRLLTWTASGRLCRHFHLSLQSGCDATLERMRRPYTVGAFAELVSAIRRRIPGVAITTDVIVGFPGETAAEFEQSRAAIAALDLAKVHVFPYSERRGTEAASLPGAVPPAVRRQRVAAMLEEARRAEEAFRQARVGETAAVLWERSREGVWSGTTDHYLKVFAFRPEKSLPDHLETVELATPREDGLWVRAPELRPATVAGRA